VRSLIKPSANPSGFAGGFDSLRHNHEDAAKCARKTAKSVQGIDWSGFMRYHVNTKGFEI